MAAQSKAVAVTGHEMAIALRCIKRLDSMKYGLKDERPKTKSALQNVLNKETSVVYVCSVSSLLYEYEKPVLFSYVDDVFKDDLELDKEIADIVMKRCADVKRTLHVLPCDSNVHTQIRAQIKSWYDLKRSQFDTENPVRGIAAASCLDYDLCADQIYTELVTLGYLREDGNTVELQLPEDICLHALEKGLKKWEQKIVEQLGDVTVRNYQHFADIVIEVNSDVQGVTAEEMGHYCVYEYSRRYPLFKATLDKNVGSMIEKLSVEDMDVTEAGGGDTDTKGKEAKNEEMELAEELPTKTAVIFPLNLQPEVAHALVQLWKMDKMSTTVQAVINQIQSVCSITYVVSPKYILSSVAGKDKTSKVKGDFTVQLHLGGTVTTKPSDVSEVTQLAMLLSFPGKKNIFKKYMKRLERHKVFYEANPHMKQPPLEVAMDDIKEIMKAFHQYIYKRSQDLAQSRRATVVLNDVQAESQCRQKLFSWLDSVNADQSAVFTEAEFSKKLIELSFKEDYWPSEAVIQKLTDIGYLEMQEDKVCYNPTYRFRGYHDAYPDVQKFLARWNTDLKPRDSSKPTAGELPMNCSEGRKRSSTALYRAGAKKAKVLDL